MEGESLEILESAGDGTAVTPEDSQGLAACIVTLSKTATGNSLGDSGEKYAEARFLQRILGIEYLALLDVVVESER